MAAELQKALAAGEGERKRGHLFVAINPGAFGDRETSAKRTSRYAAELKASRKAAGVSEIVMPGERGREKKRDTEIRHPAQCCDLAEHIAYCR